MTITRTRITHSILLLIGITGLIGGTWFLLFSLTPYSVTQQQMEGYYHYQSPAAIHLQQTKIDEYSTAFTFTSFDGAEVNGRIRYPQPITDIKQPMPVMIGVHAMGRNQLRWFQDSFKGRPTIESVDKLTQHAINNGYAVIAMDSRNHGQRKDPDNGIVDIMNNLHYWGKRQPYEAMIMNTVRDYRVLLDWITQQPQFDNAHIDIAGYSMGAQVSLLLGGIHERITDILAIVPPHLDNKTAKVAPMNLLSGLANNKVWLITANDDEFASQSQNAALFNAIPSDRKKHLRFDSSHILPADYVNELVTWF